MPTSTISPERWQRIQSLFDRAVSLTPEARAELLDATCRDEPVLRRQVASLLVASDGPPLALEDAVADALHEVATAPAIELTGRRIGPYRVLGEIGRGGMGVVLRAERADGAYDKQVAIKLASAPWASRHNLARFQAERTILARLEHPSIARLLDGGATDEGTPFLVMELVDGEPIDRACDRRRLTVDQRLHLFLAVAEAVDHAHRNLVVHRDIKPTNILVDRQGVPRLLDFGIAKLLDPAADEDPTATGSRLLTPRFASPEQVRGRAVTTASDVYALGVLLYLMLCGRLPYAEPEAAGPALVRAICDHDPVPASTAVARIDAAARDTAAARRSDPQRLRRRLAGDLDAILRQALAKDPADRYPSVRAMADDLRRHLAGRPVRAHPDRFLYRAGKWLRAHRAAVAAALLLLGALAAGLIARTIEATRANRESAAAAQVATFLADLFQAPDPYGLDDAVGAETTALALLDRGSERIRDELAGQPALQTRLLTLIGRVYGRLGRLDRAEQALDEALRLAELPGVTPALRHEARQAHGWLRIDQGALDEAASAFRGLLTDLPARQDLARADAHEGLARVLNLEQRYHLAQPHLEQALALRRRSLGDRHLAVAATLGALGYNLEQLGELDAAGERLADALALRRGLLGDGHLEVAETLDHLGQLARSRGDLAAAEAHLRRALELKRARLDDHPSVAIALANLATVVADRGRTDEAIEPMRASIAMRERLFGPRHPNLAGPLANLASIFRQAGRLDAAEAMYRDALAIERTPLLLGNYTALLVAAERFAEAEPLAAEALARYRAALPPDHWRLALAEAQLGTTLLRTERRAEGEALLEGALVSLRRAGDGREALLGTVLDRLIAHYQRTGQHDRAAEHRSERAALAER